MGSPRDGSFLWYRTSISFRGWDPQFCMGLCFGQEDRFWKSGVEIVLNSPGGEIQSERETIVSENGESDFQGWVHFASYIYILHGCPNILLISCLGREHIAGYHIQVFYSRDRRSFSHKSCTCRVCGRVVSYLREHSH